MPKIILALAIALAACSPHSHGADGQPDAAAEPTCSLTVDQICTQGSCRVMGSAYPATIGAWCAETASITANPDASAACNHWRLVSALVGDQALEFFYDANGDIAAILASSSDPPCNGACKLTCVAGPATLQASSLGSCLPNEPEVESCGEDLGS